MMTENSQEVYTVSDTTFTDGSRHPDFVAKETWSRRLVGTLGFNKVDSVQTTGKEHSIETVYSRE